MVLYIGIILIGTMLVIELSLRILIYLLLQDYIEFPKFSEQIKLKFKTHDSELGWEPVPVLNKVDSSHLGNEKKNTTQHSTYTISNKLTRYHPAPNYKYKNSFEIYGDSTCFCREVNDVETFPFYLQDVFKIGEVDNYCVGNYGLDQALIRARRRNNTKNNIIVYLPITSIPRLGMLYKHYSEIGNFLAIKPRFSYNAGKISYIPRPFNNLNEFYNLPNYKDYFRRNDNYYKEFTQLIPFKKVSLILYFIKNKYLLFELLVRLLDKISDLSKGTEYLVRRVKIILKRRDVASLFRNNNYNLEKLKIELKEEYVYILDFIFNEFNKLNRNRTIFIISPQGISIDQISQYNEIFDMIKSNLSYNESKEYLFNILDFMDNSILDDKSFDITKIHQTPRGNFEIAKSISKIINVVFVKNNNLVR